MYTLKDFLNEFSRYGVKLYTGPDILKNTGIESISVQEYPLEGYKTENELVLSTIIGCETDAERLLMFIRTIRQGGAVALGISVLGDDFCPSEQVLEYCNDNGFTLFFLPWELRFAFITKTVLNKVRESSLSIYKELQETLLHSFLIQEGLEAAASTLYYFFSAPVSIYDSNHILKQHFPDPADVHSPSAPESGEEDSSIRFPLEVNEAVYGYVEVFGESDLVQNSYDISLVQKYISLPLFLWFNREKIEDLTINRLRSDFVWNLVNKSYDSYENMLDEGLRLGHDLTHPYAGIAVRIIEEDADTPELYEYSEKSRRLMESLESVILSCRNNYSLDLFFASRGLKCLLFLDCSRNTGMDRIRAFVQDIYTGFKKADPSYDLRFGISEISGNGSPDFSALSADAELALQYCQESGEESYYFTSKDSQFYRLVLELSRNPKIYEAAKAMMDKLQGTEARNGMDLKHTLITYIQCNYNQSVTARMLFLNRHSLLYRIKKIEEITGMSLTDHRDLFTLEVYTRIMNNY